jgi:hypothetical protein
MRRRPLNISTLMRRRQLRWVPRQNHPLKCLTVREKGLKSVKKLKTGAQLHPSMLTGEWSTFYKVKKEKKTICLGGNRTLDARVANARSRALTTMLTQRVLKSRNSANGQLFWKTKITLIVSVAARVVWHVYRPSMTTFLIFEFQTLKLNIWRNT